MAKTDHYYTVFEEAQFYHVYNRTVDKQPMFRNSGNFEFFLKQYDKYLSPVTDLYSYCLLPNHFHILLRVKESTKAVKDLTTFQKLSNLPPNELANRTIHEMVSHQFRKFFQSYAMAFNKQNGRVGTLFQTPFKRALVIDEAYFTKLVYYIHSNPQHHDLISDFRDWKWSSYCRTLLEKPSKLKKEEVLNWFGGADEFKKYHALIQKEMFDDKLFYEG